MKDSELYELFLGMGDYFSKVVQYVKPLWVLFYTAVSFVLFPDEAYVPPTIGLCSALVLDVVTKYYAISRKSGGFWMAVKSRKISSEAMWKGTYKKLVSILVVMVCCGLLMRFSTLFPQIAITVATVCYAFMFYREIQSVIENMIDAGHDDLKWFLKLIKRKKEEILEDSEESESEDNTTN